MTRGGRKAATAAAAAPLVKDPARYKVRRPFPAQFLLIVSPSRSLPAHTPPLRAQTELCATFSRAGACPYGHKCQFAHGVEELRVRQVRFARRFFYFKGLPSA